MQRNVAPSRNHELARPLAHVSDTFVQRLYANRSVLTTARELGLSDRDALNSAMLAFGLGKLDFRLKDF